MIAAVIVAVVLLLLTVGCAVLMMWAVGKAGRDEL